MFAFRQLVALLFVEVVSSIELTAALNVFVIIVFVVVVVCLFVSATIISSPRELSDAGYFLLRPHATPR